MARKVKKTGKKTGARIKTYVRRTGARNILFWCAAFFCLLCLYFLYDMPGTDDVRPLQKNPSITILADDGSIITRYGGMEGNTVSVDELPPRVVQAFLAIEDRRFYDHFGIDPWGLTRAMGANVMAGRWVQGGSTITQQLAKNLFLTPDKTLRRKVQEALLALRIEWQYEKDDILSAYLNRVYFGAGAYGIDSAARTYFNKSATQLNLWEGAMLAGLLKAPSRFSPSADPALARERTAVVLHAMADAGYIDTAAAEKEVARIGTSVMGRDTGALDRYFADWVINQIDSFVSNNDRDLKVRTTFNVRLQKIAEAKKESIFAQMTPEEKISQVALITLAKDGAVLAMIGGKNYRESQFNRVTQALRQPGSSFKPFVYLAALESGYAPDDMIEDAPFQDGSYKPENYENKYYGEISLTQALAFSLNTATIRLLKEVGMAKLADVTQRLGFTRKFKAELATGLGASESTLMEMTNAYAVIANGGYAVWPYAVLSIEDASGNILYQREDTGYARLFSGSDVRDLDGMLVQVVAQGTGQGAQLSRGHVAGKTGTTQNYRDAWFIGYTDRLITGVWMGNDDNSPMERVSGGRYPARLWREYMQDGLDVPLPAPGDFSDNASFRPSSSGGDFYNMLEQWSSGFGGERARTKSGPVPSHEYNQ